MVAIKAGFVGPNDFSGTPAPFQNLLDTRRVETYIAFHGRRGIAEGFVPSVVAGQMQLSFTAGIGFVQERDGAGSAISRGYLVWNDAASIVQFGAASASTRNDAVVLAVVDPEDAGGVQGGHGGALAVGGHIAVVPGVSGVTAARTDSEINAYIGRGGWHRLYDVPILSSATQINLAGASFSGFKINDWNNIADMPYTLSAASGWSIQQAKYKLDAFRKRVSIRVMVTRTGADLGPADGQGNIGDVDITTNWPTLLLPSEDAPMIIDRSSGSSVGSGVSFARARIDNASARLMLTSLLPDATWIQTAPCLITHSYDL